MKEVQLPQCSEQAPASRTHENGHSCYRRMRLNQAADDGGVAILPSHAILPIGTERHRANPSTPVATVLNFMDRFSSCCAVQCRRQEVSDGTRSSSNSSANRRKVAEVAVVLGIFEILHYVC